MSHRTLLPLLAAAGALTLAASGGDTTADDNAAFVRSLGEPPATTSTTHLD